MKNLTFSAAIAAPKKKVWDIMLDPETYKTWTGVAWAGSYYVGEWKEGNELRFVSPEGSGTLAKLLVCRPHDHIVAEHIAILLPGGFEDRDSEQAKGWVGSIEEYSFTEKDGITSLLITMKVYPEWEAMFNTDWPKALAKLKEICEQEL
jgi:hypothetical protein